MLESLFNEYSQPLILLENAIKDAENKQIKEQFEKKREESLKIVNKEKQEKENQKLKEI